jgi:hypothetical protein
MVSRLLSFSGFDAVKKPVDLISSIEESTIRLMKIEPPSNIEIKRDFAV